MPPLKSLKKCTHGPVAETGIIWISTTDGPDRGVHYKQAKDTRLVEVAYCSKCARWIEVPDFHAFLEKILP